MCVLLFFTLDAGLLARSQYSEGLRADICRCSSIAKFSPTSFVVVKAVKFVAVIPGK